MTFCDTGQCQHPSAFVSFSVKQEKHSLPRGCFEEETLADQFFTTVSDKVNVVFIPLMFSDSHIFL